MCLKLKSKGGVSSGGDYGYTRDAVRFRDTLAIPRRAFDSHTPPSV